MLDKKVDYELYKKLKIKLKIDSENHSGGPHDDMLVDVLFDLVNSKTIMGKDWVKRLGVSRHRSTNLVRTVGELGYLERVKPHSAKPRESYLTKADLEEMVAKGLVSLAELSIRPMYHKTIDTKPSKFGDSSMFKMPTSDYSNLDSSVKLSHVSGSAKKSHQNSTSGQSNGDSEQLKKSAVAKATSLKARWMQHGSSEANSVMDSNTMVFGPKKSDSIQSNMVSAKSDAVKSPSSHLSSSVSQNSSEVSHSDENSVASLSAVNVGSNQPDETSQVSDDTKSSSVFGVNSSIKDESFDTVINDSSLTFDSINSLSDSMYNSAIAKIVDDDSNHSSVETDSSASDDIVVKSDAVGVPSSETVDDESDAVDITVSQRDYLAKHFLINVDIHSKDILTELVLNQPVEYEYTLINRKSKRVWLKNVDYDALKQFLDAFYLDRHNF